MGVHPLVERLRGEERENTIAASIVTDADTPPKPRALSGAAPQWVAHVWTFVHTTESRPARGTTW